jgi:hypothetical protein
MIKTIKTKLEIEHDFSSSSNRHFLNGIQSVYHCHHYATLYTQLALDAGETELLSDVAESTFYEMLNKYYTEKKITDIQDKINIACQYYSAMGLGTIEVQYIGDGSGKVISKKSHVEEGWIKKWNTYDKPVNYIGCGYVSAMIASILDKPIGTFVTLETESIVMGDKNTVFKTSVK